MSTLQNRIFTYLALGLLMPFTASAQSGDKKEKNKDLLDSVNWRKWAPHPAPFLTPEETAKG